MSRLSPDSPRQGDPGIVGIPGGPADLTLQVEPENSKGQRGIWTTSGWRIFIRTRRSCVIEARLLRALAENERVSKLPVKHMTWKHVVLFGTEAAVKEEIDRYYSRICSREP
jgi:hypothetical protein